MTHAPEIKIKLLSLDAKLPCYATPGAAGADLYAAEERVIPGWGHALVRTGLAMEIPPGWEVQVRPRSGLALKNMVGVLNAPGTIDSDYRGEVGVILINHSDTAFLVKAGDRIAQMVVAQAPQAVFAFADGLSATERGAGGFGSTGVRSRTDREGGFNANIR